jgi:divalent metal cation (Fe/Co/Zn/Cd) transporter
MLSGKLGYMFTTNPAAQRARLLRRGLRLEYTTLGWNLVGCVIVLIAAWNARSVALAGFGLDSVIEIFASIVVVWQLLGTATAEQEHRAMRLIGGAFMALAVYVFLQSSYVLATQAHPDRSILGIAWLAITFVVMLLLAAGKARTGTALDNEVLRTEGRVTLIDAYLAGAVLVGLVINATLHWWWADPLASLIIVYYGIREGREAWHHA